MANYSFDDNGNLKQPASKSVSEINEYINVTIVDPVEGSAPNYLVTRTYYVGDRNISLYSAYADVWSELTFDLIERGVH